MYRKHTLALLFLGAGLMLLALSTLGIYPMAHLARTASSDGQLSEPFLGLVRQSQVTMALVLLAGALLAPFASHLYSWTSSAFRKPRASMFTFLCSMGAFVLALGAQALLFDNIPHVTDATSHLFQARIFTLGRLAVPTPPCLEHFAQEGVIMGHTGLWHTKYLPGQALWLAAGGLLHAWWLPGPLSAAISAIAFHLVGRRHMSETAARVASLLFLSSPLFLLLSASYMSHATHLMLILVGLALLHEAAKGTLGSARACFAAFGLTSGLAFLTRPQDTVILAPFLLSLLLTLTPAPRRRLGILWSIAGALPAFAVFAGWNMALYGTPLSIGYAVNTNPSQTHIYRDALGLSPEFTFRQALRQMTWLLLRFNKAALGWPSSLILCALPLFSHRYRQMSALLLAPILLVAGLYFFHPYYGFEYEARYYLPLLPSVIWLSMLGALTLRDFLADRTGRPFAQSLVMLLLAIFILHALFFYWPRYILPRYKPDYEHCSTVVHRAAHTASLRNAIVVIPSSGENAFRFSSGFVFNDPLLAADVIYARDLGDDNRCLAEHFPGRALYRFVPEEDWTSGRLEFVEF